MPDNPDKTDPTQEESRPEASGDGGATSSNGGSNGGLPVTTRPAGGVLAGFGGGAVPSGLFTSSLGLGADVSQELLDLAPTFGDVLHSIGIGVADSQAQLDKGLVDTAKHLSQTKIDVITNVIQKLDDDGLPTVEDTKLITENVSLINFVSPTVHEWKHVALSMDMTVGSIDNESGMTFKAKQTSNNAHAYGLMWGFVGWFDTDSQTSTQEGTRHQRQEADWASGQVRLDALLGPRRTNKFSAPAQVIIGPSINFSQGAVQETLQNNVVTGRFLEVLINVRKANGAVNANVPLEADTDRFAFSWVADPPFGGSTTNAQGQAKLKITRDIPNPIFARPTRVKLTVRLGAVSKDLSVIL